MGYSSVYYFFELQNVTILMPKTIDKEIEEGIVDVYAR